MSARLTRSAAAALAASVLLGSAALAFPAAASAATQATSKPAVSFSTTLTGKGDQLQPGGAARTEIFKVTNNSNKTQKFTGDLVANAGGAVYLHSGELSAQVTPLGATPATTGFFLSQAPGYVGGFYPKGHRFGYFSIPAHKTFSWKITVAATRAFPANDSELFVHTGFMTPGATAPAFDTVTFKVGSGHTGGPVVEKLTGDVELTAYNHPAFELLTVTNHTGATLKSWEMLPWAAQKPGAKLAVDVWVGSAAKGHWQPLNGDLTAAGLANGATKTFELRVRVVGYTVKTELQDELWIENWSGSVIPAPHIGLLVH